jgi:hypothetical protein
MQLLSQLLAAALAGALIVPAPVLGVAQAPTRDLWVHPRGESFEPSRHYRDSNGELYYHKENDVGGALGTVEVLPGEKRIRVGLGAEVLQKASDTNGTLTPVLLYDSDGDGQVDSALPGRLEGTEAIIEGAPIGHLDFQATRWQVAVRYGAGPTGDPRFDGRYLASVDGREARLQIEPATAAPPPSPDEPELPEVGARPFPPGLVILKHREGTPFDLADFIEKPGPYIEHFDPLTRAADEDDWTVEGDRGRLTTHFDEEDLLLVRTEGEFDLEVTWGDVAFERFFEEFLAVPRNPQGCYVSLNTEMRNRDGSAVEVPHRLLYCPEMALALFDAPDGYQVGLQALRDETPHETTEAGTSIPDNIRLYLREVYPRQPSQRATGSVRGNVAAGLRDARDDLADAFRHAVTGADEQHLHTGQIGYRPSPITAPPRAVLSLLRLRPLDAVGELFAGAASAVQVGADVVSAVDNSVLTVLLQGTLGAVASPETADTAGDWIGALTQSFVKNLPFGERSDGVINLTGSWRHNRAFEPSRFTRTDTELNIDRAMTAVSWTTLRAIDIHNRDGGSVDDCQMTLDCFPDWTHQTPGASGSFLPRSSTPSP